MKSKGIPIGTVSTAKWGDSTSSRTFQGMKHHVLASLLRRKSVALGLPFKRWLEVLCHERQVPSNEKLAKLAIANLLTELSLDNTDHWIQNYRLDFLIRKKFPT